MSKLGINNLVLNRIDYREINKRKEEKTLEFNWKPFANIKEVNSSSIFTHILSSSYTPNLEAFGGNILDSKYSTENIKSNIENICNYFLKERQSLLHNEIMFLFGGDFEFLEAESSFSKLDFLIKLFENQENYKNIISFKYSSPSTYFNSVKNIGIEFPVMENEDFLPYSYMHLDYFTGYYTSRPYFKGMMKDFRNFFDQASKIVFDLLLNKGTSFRKLNR